MTEKRTPKYGDCFTSDVREVYNNYSLKYHNVEHILSCYEFLPDDLEYYEPLDYAIAYRVQIGYINDK